MVKFTEYFKDFLSYYSKAGRVQTLCNIGGYWYEGSCGDELMEKVHIYDTIHRRHAGFQNMLQDLWFGSSAPKYFKWSPEHKERNDSYNENHGRWGDREWMFIFLTHRITGSGASFEHDHGYRNTILPELAKLDSVDEMVDWITNYDGVMYTSIGNQIPAFPKPTPRFKTGGKYYFACYAKWLIEGVYKFLNKKQSSTIREVVDFMCEWNRNAEIKAFHFQYTAFAADLADYMPELVKEGSHMYYGKNAKEAMNLFARKPRSRMTRDQFYDIVMDEAVAKTGGYPKDLEDVMCDYIRYVENYIPSNREGTYDGLDRTKVWNSSLITDHPKGRQKWQLAGGLHVPR